MPNNNFFIDKKSLKSPSYLRYCVRNSFARMGTFFKAVLILRWHTRYLAYLWYFWLVQAASYNSFSIAIVIIDLQSISKIIAAIVDTYNMTMGPWTRELLIHLTVNRIALISSGVANQTMRRFITIFSARRVFKGSLYENSPKSKLFYRQ